MTENLKEKIDQLDIQIKTLVQLEEKKKEKNINKFFKINEGKVKKGYVPILLLKSSAQAELHYVQPNRGVYSFNGKYYKEEPSCYWIISKKNPFVIIPEWSLTPLNRDEMYRKDVEKKNLQSEVSYAIEIIEHAEIEKLEEELGKKKKGFSPKALILFGIIGLIGWAIMKGLGGAG